jgi:hypothetical protein
LPSIQATLSADLTTATGVKFIMKADQGNTIKVNAAATIVTPRPGVVRYDWLAADTDVAGSYQAEWEVTWAGGKTQTFPDAHVPHHRRSGGPRRRLVIRCRASCPGPGVTKELARSA